MPRNEPNARSTPHTWGQGQREFQESQRGFEIPPARGRESESHEGSSQHDPQSVQDESGWAPSGRKYARPSSFRPPLFKLETSETFPGWRPFDKRVTREYNLSKFLARMLELRQERMKDQESSPFDFDLSESLKEFLALPIKPTRAKELATQVISWLVLEGHELGFQAREGSEADFKQLPPLLFSTHIVADVVYALMLPAMRQVVPTCPLVCFEIHSQGSTYKETIAKMIAVCVDHLRLLMNIEGLAITEVRGFVFPNETEKSVVTEVWVRWNAQFQFGFRPFTSIEEARNAIMSWKFHMETECRKVTAVNEYPTLLPLSPAEVNSFGALAQQIGSNSSIIVYDEEKKLYHKWCYESNREWNVSLATSKVVVTPTGKRHLGRLCFDVFPKKRRMTLEQVRADNLISVYVKAVYEALTMIHSQDNRAHLDVRFENTCFWADGHSHELLLIDFDRSMWADEDPGGLSQIYRSNMYVSEPGWTAAQLDLKQLGLLIGRLIDPFFNVETAGGRLHWAQPLISSLVSQGKWNQAAFDKWSVSLLKELPPPPPPPPLPSTSK